ncbi:hypothetical protein [uncultured Enterovirga sp.]|uniref:hypothetical protein n=1 Tax=uncultured Enterovirga sp. TaxID=2026352 RepID=UPI0035CA3AA8
MANASRRGFLAALGALSGGAAVPVAMAAAPAVAIPADAELIAAGEVWTRAAADRDAAQAAQAEAETGFRHAMGWCPPALRYQSFDCELVDLAREVTKATGVRLRPEWDYFEEFGPETWANRWDGQMLRDLLRWLPEVRGRAGRTPFLIRRLRQLLPLAEARDAQNARWREHYQLDAHHEAGTATRKAVSEAEAAVIALPAATLAGVAVKARLAEEWLRYHSRQSGWSFKQPDCMMAVLRAALDASPGGA